MGKVLTLEEVAEFLRVHPSTIYRLLRKRGIPAFKLGADWRFNLESIERWVKERESATGLAQPWLEQAAHPMAPGRPVRRPRAHST
jgi:excisionase family DNA binding protein